MKCGLMRHFIRVCTVCQSSVYRFLEWKGFIQKLLRLNSLSDRAKLFREEKNCKQKIPEHEPHREEGWSIKYQEVSGDMWFQQCGSLTSVDSDEPVQPSFMLRNSKWCSVSSLTLIEYSILTWATLKGKNMLPMGSIFFPSKVAPFKTWFPWYWNILCCSKVGLSIQIPTY